MHFCAGVLFRTGICTSVVRHNSRPDMPRATRIPFKVKKTEIIYIYAKNTIIAREHVQNHGSLTNYLVNDLMLPQIITFL